MIKDDKNYKNENKNYKQVYVILIIIKYACNLF